MDSLILYLLRVFVRKSKTFSKMFFFSPDILGGGGTTLYRRKKSYRL